MKKGILLSFFAFSVVLVLTSGTEDINGKAGRTGSPGEVTCRDGCHSSFALNSGSGSVVLTSSNMVNNEYVPGQVYNMALTVTHSGLSLFGLGLEALTTANANAGTITAGTGSQIKSITVSGVSRKNLTHRLNGGSGTNGAHTFSFTWTAPAAGTGNVNFYFAGVAANGNNQNSQDYVYTGTQLFTEFVTPSGINEASATNSLAKFYPNPVSDKFTLSYNLNNSEAVNAGIYSLSGQLLQQLSGDINNTDNNTAVISLNENIRTGIYILKVTAGNKTQAQKLVVQ